MKTIGLIGGLTWLSTLDYYRHLNQMVNDQLGGVSSAKILMSSVEFSEIKTLTEALDWDGLARLIGGEAKKLETAGADCILIGANTMHYIADKVQAAIQIPLIHIAEETAKVIAAQHLTKVALLGTRYTMQMDFYKQKLAAHGIATIIPNDADIAYINETIYAEMSKGIFLPERKQAFIRIIGDLAAQGAQGVVLGCTEIPILIQPTDVAIPIFDTAYTHSAAAVRFVLGG